MVTVPINAFAYAHRLTVAGTLEINSSLFASAGGTVADLVYEGDSLGWGGDLTVTSAFLWSAGALNGPGDFVIGSSASATVETDPGGPNLMGVHLFNHGDASWSSDGILTLYGVWENAEGSTFTANTPTAGQLIQGGSQFVNRGTFTKTGAGTITFTDATLDNTGTVDVQAGTLSLGSSSDGTSTATINVASGATFEFDSASATFTLTDTSAITGSGTVALSAGTLTLGGTITASAVTIASGATVQGAATIDADVSNDGTLIVAALNSAGVLAINGDYVQGAGGTLAMEIGGTVAGGGYDRLDVSGTATLDGTLDVAFIDGFTATSGQSFELLSFGSRSGTFDTLTGSASSLSPLYEDEDFTLTA